MGGEEGFKQETDIFWLIFQLNELSCTVESRENRQAI
jgi:hypothetical protein